LLGENDDPVLHNNTLRTVDYFPSGEKGYREFRRRVDEGNERVKFRKEV
jgi:hypothetical protein